MNNDEQRDGRGGICCLQNAGVELMNQKSWQWISALAGTLILAFACQNPYEADAASAAAAGAGGSSGSGGAAAGKGGKEGDVGEAGEASSDAGRSSSAGRSSRGGNAGMGNGTAGRNDASAGEDGDPPPDDEPDAGSNVPMCTPGMPVPCTCAGNVPGTQLCSDDGMSVIGRCSCNDAGSDPPMGSAGTGSVPPADGGTPTPNAAGYAGLIYEFTTPNGATVSHISVYHEATDTAGNVLLRTPPYGPFTGSEGPLDQRAFVWGVAWDGGNTGCDASETGSISCTVHVPVNAKVHANVHFWNWAGSSEWACATSTGGRKGTFRVRNAATGQEIAVTTEAFPVDDPSALCRFVFIAPSQ